MDGLETRIQAAQEDVRAMDGLLRDYLPFLKKQAALSGPGLDYDDRLSLAMLAFTNAVRCYHPDRGAFLSFAQVCIHNRLADEGRRVQRYTDNVVSFPEHTELVAADSFDLALEQQGLAEEIRSLSCSLAQYGIVFSDLPALCPKQKRARRQCLALAACVTADEQLRLDFIRSGRLPQAELARRFSISPKTVEKHRKYIVTLVAVLMGDFPSIRAFLPKGEV